MPVLELLVELVSLSPTARPAATSRRLITSWTAVDAFNVDTLTATVALSKGQNGCPCGKSAACTRRVQWTVAVLL